MILLDLIDDIGLIPEDVFSLNSVYVDRCLIKITNQKTQGTDSLKYVTLFLLLLQRYSVNE